MKYLLAITIITIILNFSIAAPAYDYNSPATSAERQPAAAQAVQNPNIKIVKSNSYETSVNPLEGKNYDFVQADCQSLGDDVQYVGNKELKIHKIGCVYPGDGPIRQDILQAVNEHFRARIAQYATH